jgi:hypothetical protein
VDHSDFYSNFGGFYNAPNHANSAAFAVLKADGSIVAWGDPDWVATSDNWGGKGAPSDNGYTKIYSNLHAFAALKADGSITAWGNSSYGGTTPSGSGYTVTPRLD